MIRGRPDYELIEHTADVGIVVRAESLERLFETAAAAMFDLMYDVESARPGPMVHRVALREDDLAAALAAWLGELLSWAMAEGAAPGAFEVTSVAPGRAGVDVRGQVLAEPLDPARHRFETELKAVTYHGIDVGRRNGNWEARVIFDV
ncbi:MAG: archease [Acidobacteria bacterium]|nr:MAG: archease [Acidobacteriota bacterium]